MIILVKCSYKNIQESYVHTIIATTRRLRLDTSLLGKELRAYNLVLAILIGCQGSKGKMKSHLRTPTKQKNNLFRKRGKLQNHKPK